MKNTAVLPVLLGLALAPAAAQPAPKNDPQLETVIVTAPKLHAGVTPGAIAHDFIGSYVAPTPFLGKVARWNPRNPLCPNASGFSPENASFIVERIKKIAGEAGAAVSKNAACKANMVVIATTVPQAVLEEIRAHRTDLLGYYDSPAQADAKTVMKFPIQALYETSTIDNNGNVLRDMVYNPACDPLPYCSFMSTGGRARNGLESAFYNVTIIVDASQTGHNTVGEIADYVAMLALSRTQDYEDCQLMPSITNLFTSNCDDKLKTNAITASDIAYLRGVYKMDAGATLQIQQDQIAGEMAKVLASGK